MAYPFLVCFEPLLPAVSNLLSRGRYVLYNDWRARCSIIAGHFSCMLLSESDKCVPRYLYDFWSAALPHRCVDGGVRSAYAYNGRFSWVVVRQSMFPVEKSLTPFLSHLDTLSSICFHAWISFVGVHRSKFLVSFRSVRSGKPTHAADDTEVMVFAFASHIGARLSGRSYILAAAWYHDCWASIMFVFAESVPVSSGWRRENLRHQTSVISLPFSSRWGIADSG